MPRNGSKVVPIRKREREAALKKVLDILDGANPEAAQAVRGALQRRTARAQPVEIKNSFWAHPTFWMNQTGFLRWQSLRRNENYKSWVSERLGLLKNGALLEFFNNHFSLYLKTYPPFDGQNFSTWEHYVKQRTGRSLSDVQIQWSIKAKVILWEKVPPGLPDRWLPLPVEIDFLHPDLLRLLTASTTGMAVSTVPFDGMEQIQVRGRSLWVDLTRSWQEIGADIGSYNSFLKFRNRGGKNEALAEARRKLEAVLRSRKRNSVPLRKRSTRKRDPQPPRAAEMFAAYDLKQVTDESYSWIASKLWPDKYSKAKKHAHLALIRRAKDMVRDAKINIDQAMPAIT